jgi:hypothetical protein
VRARLAYLACASLLTAIALGILPPQTPASAVSQPGETATRREGWADTWNGIILMDGPGVDAPINRLDRLYQELAGVR